MKKSKKNISKKVRNGTTVQTRDEHFCGQGKYRKPGYEDKGYYRRAVVVDSNRDDELALVKLGTSSGTYLPNYQKGKSRYRDEILTLDDTGMPIKIGNKFIENSDRRSLTMKEANQIKKDIINSRNNRKRLQNIEKKIKNERVISPAPITDSHCWITGSRCEIHPRQYQYIQIFCICQVFCEKRSENE